MTYQLSSIIVQPNQMIVPLYSPRRGKELVTPSPDRKQATPTFSSWISYCRSYPNTVHSSWLTAIVSTCPNCSIFPLRYIVSVTGAQTALRDHFLRQWAMLLHLNDSP